MMKNNRGGREGVGRDEGGREREETWEGEGEDEEGRRK